MSPLDTHTAFQDQIPHNHCFGCGPLNPHGLQIKSYWRTAEEAICRFRTDERFAAGPTNVLNGGIIATLIDCHSICTAIADHYQREQRVIGSEPRIWCVTGSLEIDYLKPAALPGEVELIARVGEIDGRKTRISCSLSVAGRECARGEVLSVRVNKTPG